MENSRFASVVSVLQIVTFMQEICSGRIKAPLLVKFSNSIRFFNESQRQGGLHSSQVLRNV